MRISWKWLAPAIAVVALLAVLGGGWYWATQFQQAATAGKRAASTAVTALSKLDVPQAKQEFAVAVQEFGRARSMLGPDWLQSLPWAGPQLTAAAELTDIGGIASTAGGQLSDLLDQATASTTQNRFGTVAKLSGSHLEPALGALSDVGRRTAGMSTDGLVSPLANAVDELKKLVGTYQGVFDAAPSVQQLAHYLFSQQHRFVLISQNNAELRPVGGFSGTYGLVGIGPDGFQLEKYQGIYRLPDAKVKLPAPEGATMTKRLQFRDANWWIDLPTSAQVMLQLWDSSKQPNVDGIIAIDVVTLRELLTVFGPVTLPGTNEVLDKDNATKRLTEFIEFDRAHYGKVAKAEALVPMVESMLKNIETVKTSQLKPLLQVMSDLAAEKHIQLYARDQVAQSAIVGLGIGGAIAPPEDTTDLLVASSAVVCATKTNLGVSRTMDYAVALNADGSATSKLALGFTKTSELYEGLHIQYYCDYLRVYRAPDTALTDAKSSGGFVNRPEDGRPVFAQYFRLQPGTHVTQHLDTTVAKAMTVAVDGRSAHYRLLLVRQADLADTALTLKVAAPSGWRFSAGAATWRPGGADPVTVGLNGTTATVKTSLQRDLIVDLDLTKD